MGLLLIFKFKFMKIINKILINLSFLFAIIGCGDDRLDINPTDRVGINSANKNESTLESVKNGIYYKLANDEVFGRDVIVAGDLLSDDSFVSVKNSNRFTTLNIMDYSESSNDIYPIDYLYDAYNQANVVINTTLPETSNVKQMKAEAYAAKALVLFYAVNLYSPSIASGLYQDYGVPIYSTNYDPNLKYPRSTIAEVYDEIERNSLQALSLFQNEPSSKQFLGPTAVKLLLSRSYLFQQKWQKAYNYAVEVENMSGSLFQFVNKADYPTYFYTNNAPETVFELGYSQNNSPQINHIAGVYAIDGAYKQNEFRQSLYDIYDASDIRKTMYVYDSKNIGNNIIKGYFTKKYTIANEYSQSIKIFRMTEAKLNKIEALYHLGNESQALAELNAFVATRGIYTYSSTGTQLLNDILKERRLEFAAEGYRFFDLKRNMLPINKVTNCSACTVLPTDKKFVLPMPQWEIINNPKMEQYPEYKYK